ncbi:hypothetical protein ACFVQ4_17725 [Streptomyces laurentii]|uniref:hypothetical protein n=1 Tax=Streptomyces laurentii TaxID=39478 RepID=UPI0036CCBB92
MAEPQSNAATSAFPVITEIPADAPPAGVVHFRHRHTERFTVVGNHLAQNTGLSAAAIGIAVYIQSLPDGVSVTAKALTLRFREGETTIRRVLNELERTGYIARPRIPLGGGKFATRTLSYDKPGCVPSAEPTPAPKPTAQQQQQHSHSEPEPQVATPSPDTTPPSSPEPRPAQSAQPTPPPTSPGAGPTAGPAMDLLAGLRRVDARLVLSVRDVQRLAPAVEIWLARSATLAQITRTLTAGLPAEPVPIHHPARFLEYRLANLLPPPLPALVEDRPQDRPAPLVTCDGCDRAFRTHDPAPDVRCADCRTGTGTDADAA